MTRLAALLVLVAACGGDADAPDAAPVIGPVTVSGLVRYEDRQPLPSGFLSTTVTPVVARFVSVSLIAMDGTNLGTSVTGADGSYALTAQDITYGDSVHILAATMSTDPMRPVTVTVNNGLVHGFRAPDFEARASATVDVLVSETSGEAGAFNVFDQLIDAVTFVGALGATPQPITAVWRRNNTDGTYYDDFDNTMYLLGEASDDDGYDDPVILHESGHYIEDTLGRSDNPGGPHNGSPDDPRLAWSEGFATYWAMAVLGAPVYIDTAAGGGWSYNGDTSVTAIVPPVEPIDVLLVSEDTVTEMLWDLGDAPGADDDPIAGDHHPVVSVQIDYLRSAVLRTFGPSGADLVDFLDGFFLGDGLTRCAGVQSIVTTVRSYPYDYAGPAGACP